MAQMEFLPQLAMWPVSGISLNVETFQSQLKSLSSHPGGVKHPELMTPISKSGWAGVLNGVVIPFQDPFLMLRIFWLTYTLRDTSPECLPICHF